MNNEDILKKLEEDVDNLIDHSFQDFWKKKHKIGFIKVSVFYKYVKNYLIENGFYKDPPQKKLFVDFINEKWSISFESKRCSIKFPIDEKLSNIIDEAEKEFEKIYRWEMEKIKLDVEKK